MRHGSERASPPQHNLVPLRDCVHREFVERHPERRGYPQRASGSAVLRADARGACSNPMVSIVSRGKDHAQKPVYFGVIRNDDVGPGCEKLLLLSEVYLMRTVHLFITCYPDSQAAYIFCGLDFDRAVAEGQEM